MRKLYVIILLTSTYFHSFSQDKIVKKLQADASTAIKKDPKDTTVNVWKRGGEVSFNLTQGSLSNWAAGGDKFALSVNSQVNYFVFYTKGKKSWDNTFNFNFGLVQTTSLGTRKNDDRFDMLSKYGYKISDNFHLATLFNFRTQFFRGFTYPKPDSAVFSSTFLSPAYLLVSEGFDYKPNNKFSAFVSPATARFVIVANDALAQLGIYGPVGKYVDTEVGAFASLNYTSSFTNNVSYKARLDLFSNYRHKPGNVDIFMTNYLAFKINRYLSATYNLDMVYDDDVKLFGDDGKSARLQLKSLIGIGFLMRLK